MAALRRSSRISRKERIRNVTIRQQIGLEEPVIKEIEQNQLTWYGHVQRMAEGRLRKIASKWMPKQKRARGRPKKNWMEGIRRAMNERNLNEGQWEDRKQWSLGVGQRKTTFWNRHTYIHNIYLHKTECGPGSSVGIATELRDGRSGIESRWGRDFPSVQTGPGAHSAFCKMGTGSFPGLNCGRGVLLTTHPLLVPRSWKSRAVPLPTLWATPGL